MPADLGLVDERSTTELFRLALSESDETLRWEYVTTLQRRGADDVFAECESLSKSSCRFERILAADILGQLGTPERFREQDCQEILRMMLRRAKDDHQLLCSILLAIGHQSDAAAAAQVVRYVAHPNAEVRDRVVFALLGQTNQLAIDNMIRLTNDPKNHIRDWATFGIGQQIEVDTPQIRDALVARLCDPDTNTRCEALIGLARRKDQRCIPAIAAELRRESVGRLAVEAAAEIAAQELYQPLIEISDWWDVAPEQLSDAIAACS